MTEDETTALLAGASGYAAIFCMCNEAPAILTFLLIIACARCFSSIIT